MVQNAKGSDCVGFKVLHEQRSIFLLNPLWNIFQGERWMDHQSVRWNDYKIITCLHKDPYQNYERVVLIGDDFALKLEIDSETYELASYSIQGNLSIEHNNSYCYIRIEELAIGLQIDDCFFDFDPKNPPKIEWDSSFRY